LNGTPVPSGNIGPADWDWGDGTATAAVSGNLASHPYAVPAPYTVVAKNVTVVGTTQKGTGSTTIQIH
jgi:hypothetical protein